MRQRYCVMVLSGHTYVKVFSGDYQTCQWRVRTLERDGKKAFVELDI